MIKIRADKNCMKQNERTKNIRITKAFEINEWVSRNETKIMTITKYASNCFFLEAFLLIDFFPIHKQNYVMDGKNKIE